jgi:serine/threonine-protein kinase
MTDEHERLSRALPDYEIGHELGRGQFGVVRAARHRQLGREVAVKQLAGPGATAPEYVARFRREARILAQMDHPHVVTVFDYREEDDLRLLVMELLPGGTFADRRAAGIGPETAVAAAIAAATGLGHVHEQGILHRDVKPENLMFDRRATLKVTDFGIARGDLVDATVINLTRAGELFGTPAYVAPEQAAHAIGVSGPPVGTASDQYSLAAVLYEALSGRLTHDATGGAVALCRRRVAEDAQPLREVAPSVPVELDAVVMKALARHPDARYASCEDFAAALAAAATDGLGADWLGRSEVEVRDARPLLGPRPTAAEPESERAGAPRRSSRNRVLAFAGVAAVAMVVLLAVFLVLDRGSGKSAQSAGRPVAASGTKLSKVWSARTGGAVFSSPALADGLVVVGSDDTSLYAFDATSGALRWRQGTRGPARSSPVVSSGTVYAASYDGNVYALALQSGSVLWKAPVGYEIASSPAVASGTVVVGADKLYAFDAATGARRWAFTPSAPIVSSPAIAGDVVVVGSNDHEIYGVSLADGLERWRLRSGDAVQSSPVIAGGVAYVGSNDGFLYAVDVSTGASKWATDLMAPVKSSPIVDGDRVIVGTDGGRLVSVDAATGKVGWTFTAGDRIDSSPAVLGGTVVVGSNDGNLYAVDAATGALRGTFRTDGPVLSTPLVVGSAVVVGSDDGTLYKVRGFAH